MGVWAVLDHGNIIPYRLLPHQHHTCPFSGRMDGGCEAKWDLRILVHAPDHLLGRTYLYPTLVSIYT